MKLVKLADLSIEQLEEILADRLEERTKNIESLIPGHIADQFYFIDENGFEIVKSRRGVVRLKKDDKVTFISSFHGSNGGLIGDDGDELAVEECCEVVATYLVDNQLQPA